MYKYSTIQPLLSKIEYLQNQINNNNNNNNNNNTNNNNENDGEYHEVGSLTISPNDELQGKYVGAATGSNFAKLLLNQVQLPKLENIDNISSNNFIDMKYFTNLNIKSFATIPTYSIGKFLTNNYINLIQPYFPIINIKHLLINFEKLYKCPQNLDYHEKYILFMVFAISSERCENCNYLNTYHNQFKPIEYYNTSQKYFDKINNTRSINTIQELLILFIWVQFTNIFKDDNGDSWYLGRYIMSLVMEFNLHNVLTDSLLSNEEKEFRNRLFWTTYVLERTNAVKCGRGLSLREDDINVPLPIFNINGEDSIIDNNNNNTSSYLEKFEYPSYNEIKFNALFISIRLNKIYTILLETVYISRTKGQIPKLSMESIIQYKENLQKMIFEIIEDMNKNISIELMYYHELIIKAYIASIMLNRPSPSFLNPDNKSILQCKEDCEKSLDSFLFLINTEYKLIPSYLHDLVNIGLTMNYCCMKIDSNSDNLKKFSNKLIEIMNKIINDYPNFIKFKNLYIIISSIIIESFTNNNNEINEIPKPLVQIKEQLNNIRQDKQKKIYMRDPFKTKDGRISKATIVNDVQSPRGGLSTAQYDNLFQYPINEQTRYNEIDPVTQELFQDVFKRYYQGNDSVQEDISELFEFQKFNWN